MEVVVKLGQRLSCSREEQYIHRKLSSTIGYYYYSTLLFTSSVHCLCCPTRIRLYFQLFFPRSIFMRYPGWITDIFICTTPCFCPLMPIVEAFLAGQNPFTSCSGPIFQIIDLLYWVGESSGGERSNMGRIRHGRIVCDLRSHIDMNLTASVPIVYLSYHHHVHVSRCKRLHDQG